MLYTRAPHAHLRTSSSTPQRYGRRASCRVPPILRSSDDVLLEILESLDGRDIVMCKAVCRRLKKVVSETVSLQYKVELFSSGMLDSQHGPHTLTLAERLARLRSYNAAWRCLEWTTCGEVLPHLQDYSHSADVATSASIYSRRAEDSMQDTIMQQIPSQLRGIPERHTSLLIPAQISDIWSNVYTDAAQDLYVIVVGAYLGFRCFMRSISSGEDHPLGCGILEVITSLPPRPGFQTSVDICNAQILITICGRTSAAFEIILGNWQSGAVLSKQTTSERCGSYVNNGHPKAYFLDDDHILLEHLEPDACDCGHSSIQVYTIDSDDGLGATPSYTFVLPDFMQILYPPHRLSPLSKAWMAPRPAVDTGHFHPNPADRLLTVILSVPADRGQFDEHYVDIPLHTLRSYVAAHPGGVVPWAAWGPRGARATRVRVPRGLSAVYRMNEQGFVGGLRRLLLCPAADGAPMILLLDYHPQRIARGRLCAEGALEAGAEMLAALAIGGVETALPCLASAAPAPQALAEILDGFDQCGIRLCEDGMVFLDNPSVWVSAIKVAKVFSI
ncbi:hypothetical protein BV25DRAFT_1992207 [Artomyces pyxidatus]|uniref:Uncharacterized protein n=1 Tax=Artomyces pyxidatus TaxID=48021 RepID=A0ACB8SZA2_9AGAM|nr:hypothetical protein BV25DRAFT_1992207 [Artomyces pyxidatus]